MTYTELTNHRNDILDHVRKATECAVRPLFAIQSIFAQYRDEVTEQNKKQFAATWSEVGLLTLEVRKAVDEVVNADIDWPAVHDAFEKIARGVWGVYRKLEDAFELIPDACVADQGDVEYGIAMSEYLGYCMRILDRDWKWIRENYNN